MTISEVLYQCDEEISKPVSPRRRRSLSSQHSGTKWSDSEDDFDDDEESTPLLDFQIALSIAVEALGQAMVGPWPDINDIARLSPEILTVPSSLDGATEPAQMIVLEAVLPSIMVDDGGPMFREKQSASPTPGAGANNRSAAIRPFSVTDKPPAPFTFTPFPLFSSAQTMLIKGRGAKEFAREVSVFRLNLSLDSSCPESVTLTLCGCLPLPFVGNGPAWAALRRQAPGHFRSGACLASAGGVPSRRALAVVDAGSYLLCCLLGATTASSRKLPSALAARPAATSADAHPHEQLAQLLEAADEHGSSWWCRRR